MRAVAATVLFFLLTALIWALHPPLAAFAAVRALRNPRADVHALEGELRRAGQAAKPALRRGLAADDWRQRAHCARLLALSGDRDGDACLLQILRQQGSGAPDPAAAMAEALISSVWMERGAPPPLVRAQVLGGNNSEALTAVLQDYPAWSGGYVARARMSQRNGDAAEARHYAMLALAAQEENFEAMVVLAQACLTLDLPGQAMLCLEHAVGLNPRLKPVLGVEIRKALNGLDQERARRRKEKQQREPLA